MRHIYLILLICSTYLGLAQGTQFNVSLVNSSADEQSPFLSADGRVMFFTRGHHPQNIGGKPDKGDIWISTLDDSSGWSAPVRLPNGLNNPYFNGAFAVANNQLYSYGVARESSSPGNGVSLSDLVQWPEKWSTPREVAIKYYQNKSANFGNSISADGRIMLLSLESYKSFGAEDLYVSFRDEQTNSWTEPVNLGAVINTAFQELTPYLTPDNKTLYFSSNGHGGYGSRDIFVSQRLDESFLNWSTPINLGSEINSEGAEMGYQYYPNFGLAIFTSTKDSDGYGDIRIIPVKDSDLDTLLTEPLLTEPLELPITAVVVPSVVVSTPDSLVKSNKITLTGKISDTEGVPVFARVKAKSIVGVEQEHFNDSTYRFELEYGQNYVIQVDAEGYISENRELAAADSNISEIKQDFALEAIAVGKTIALKSVLFVRGTTELLASSYDELNLVADMMLNNPSMRIELSGHTDNVGNPSLNKRLSQERVDAVMDYLVEKKVDKSRLSGKGYGGSKPVAPNTAEATRKLNRRVEFTIVQQ